MRRRMGSSPICRTKANTTPCGWYLFCYDGRDLKGEASVRWTNRCRSHGFAARRERAARNASGRRRFYSRKEVPAASSPQASLGLRRLFCFTNKSSLRFVPLRLLSAKGPARLVCSLVNALTTTRSRYQPFAGVPSDARTVFRSAESKA